MENEGRRIFKMKEKCWAGRKKETVRRQTNLFAMIRFSERFSRNWRMRETSFLVNFPDTPEKREKSAHQVRWAFPPQIQTTPTTIMKRQIIQILCTSKLKSVAKWLSHKFANFVAKSIYVEFPIKIDNIIIRSERN